MNSIVKPLLILQNYHSRNINVVSYMVKLNLSKKIHLRRPDLRIYIEFSRLGSYETEVLETQQQEHMHPWRSTADKS